MAVVNNIKEIREQRGSYQDELAEATGYCTCLLYTSLVEIYLSNRKFTSALPATYTFNPVCLLYTSRCV